jgi:16S rRNA C1402 (ribose-2'-O) methylase RsmI
LGIFDFGFSIFDWEQRWGDQAARGEFTLVVAGSGDTEGDMEAALADAVSARAEGAPLSAAVREAARRHGVRRRELYELALEAGEDPSALTEL